MGERQREREREMEGVWSSPQCNVLQENTRINDTIGIYLFVRIKNIAGLRCRVTVRKRFYEILFSSEDRQT